MPCAELISLQEERPTPPHLSPTQASVRPVALATWSEQAHVWEGPTVCGDGLEL